MAAAISLSFIHPLPLPLPHSLSPFASLMDNNSSRRRLNEVDTSTQQSPEINFFNLQPHHPSQVQQILNNAAPFVRPFSFTALLMAPDDEPNTNSCIQVPHLDDAIILHGEKMRRELGEMLKEHHGNLIRVVEETAAKKLKEKEMELQEKLARKAELERQAEYYKAEVDRMAAWARYLEQVAVSLRSDLEEATAARQYAETVQEDEESAFEDSERVKPGRLNCKACGRGMATVMMWPCRHVCICMQCDAAVMACPVCCESKTESVEVIFSVD